MACFLEFVDHSSTANCLCDKDSLNWELWSGRKEIQKLELGCPHLNSSVRNSKTHPFYLWKLKMHGHHLKDVHTYYFLFFLKIHFNFSQILLFFLFILFVSVFLFLSLEGIYVCTIIIKLTRFAKQRITWHMKVRARDSFFPWVALMPLTFSAGHKTSELVTPFLIYSVILINDLACWTLPLISTSKFFTGVKTNSDRKALLQ